MSSRGKAKMAVGRNCSRDRTTTWCMSLVSAALDEEAESMTSQTRGADGEDRHRERQIMPTRTTSWCMSRSPKDPREPDLACADGPSVVYDQHDSDSECEISSNASSSDTAPAIQLRLETLPNELQQRIYFFAIKDSGCHDGCRDTNTALNLQSLGISIALNVQKVIRVHFNGNLGHVAGQYQKRKWFEEEMTKEEWEDREGEMDTGPWDDKWMREYC